MKAKTPMRQVLVHIGLEKAASTSLQATLIGARNALEAQNVAFPQIGGGGFKQQKDLRIAFEGDPAIRERAVTALAKVADSQNVLLTSETLYYVPPDDLLTLLADAGFGDAAVRAVAVVRDPAGWINSRYAFEASQFFRVGSFNGFAKRAIKTGRASWMKAFGPWMAHEKIAFEAVPLRIASGEGVVGRVIAALGLDPDGIEEAKGLNEAVDARTVEAALQLVPHAIGRDGRLAVRRTRNALLEAAADEGWTGRFQGLDPERTKRINDACRADLEAFAQAAWGAPWDAVYAMPKAPTETNEWVRKGGSAADKAAIARVVARVRKERGLTLSAPQKALFALRNVVGVGR